jgi:hypothetical protein
MGLKGKIGSEIYADLGTHNYFILAATAKNCLLVSVLAFLAEATTSDIFAGGKDFKSASICTGVNGLFGWRISAIIRAMSVGSHINKGSIAFASIFRSILGMICHSYETI